MTSIPSNSLGNNAALGMLQATATSLNSASGSSAIDLSALSLLNGGGNGVSPLSATQLYNYYDKNGAAMLDKSNNSRQVKDAIDYFTTRIKNVKSVAEIFKDPKLYSFVTTAVGLSSTANSQQGLIKRALTGFVIPPDQVQTLKDNGLLTSSGRPVDSAAQATLVAQGFLDPANPTRIGVANQLSDPTYANAAAILNFANTGVKTIQSQETINTLVRQFKSVSFEDSINRQSSAVAEARYALAKLPAIGEKANPVKAESEGAIKSPTEPNQTIAGRSGIDRKNPIYNLLSDSTLRDFVSTAFNIPPQVVSQSIQGQAAIFASKVNVKQLNDPNYVNKLIKTYLTQIDTNTVQASASKGQAMISLFGN
ncbi:MAG: DUF1217 domain-containing protein [Alphaproteobacteria bacterium]|nr:DUF1217 domain-containing protein [Alphaproteobacteria bacterium]